MKQNPLPTGKGEHEPNGPVCRHPCSRGSVASTQRRAFWLPSRRRLGHSCGTAPALHRTSPISAPTLRSGPSATYWIVPPRYHHRPTVASPRAGANRRIPVLARWGARRPGSDHPRAARRGAGSRHLRRDRGGVRHRPGDDAAPAHRHDGGLPPGGRRTGVLLGGLDLPPARQVQLRRTPPAISRVVSGTSSASSSPRSCLASTPSRC